MFFLFFFILIEKDVQNAEKDDLKQQLGALHLFASQNPQQERGAFIFCVPGEVLTRYGPELLGARSTQKLVEIHNSRNYRNYETFCFKM